MNQDYGRVKWWCFCCWWTFLKIIFAPLGSSFRRKLKLPKDTKTELQHEQNLLDYHSTNLYAVTSLNFNIFSLHDTKIVFFYKKSLHQIRFFDKKTQLTAPETANKMNLLWIKKGAAQKCESIIRKHIYIN